MSKRRMALVRKGTRDEIREGDTVENGPYDDIPEEFIVTGFRAPTHPGSSGRVLVRTKEGQDREFFPHVFDLEIVEVEDGD